MQRQGPQDCNAEASVRDKLQTAITYAAGGKYMWKPVLAVVVLISVIIGQCQGPKEDPNPAWCSDETYRAALLEEMGFYDSMNYIADNCNN